MLLVTHDVDEAVALADRVLVLDKSRIATEERIALDRPRQSDAAFQAIRRRLLGRLGVAQTAPGELVAFPTGEIVH